MLRAAQRRQQLLALTLVQAEEGVDIRAAIAVFGEEAGDGFRGVVGADDDPFGHPCDTVLRFHALTGFLVAADKIAQFNTGFTQGLLAGQYRTFDVYGKNTVRLNKRDRILTVLLVSLHAIRQTYGNKLQRGVTGLVTQLGDGHLAQLTGQSGILTAADAQHQRLQERVCRQVSFQKINATTDLFIGINRRFRAQRLNNFLLQSHYALPMQNQTESVIC